MSSGLVLPDLFSYTPGFSTWEDSVVVAILVVYALGYWQWTKPDPYASKWLEKPQASEATSSSRKKETRNISHKLHEAKKDIAIFWGSQSGTAERFAQELARKCKTKFGLEALVADLSDYDHETISSIHEPNFAIFILSTFGEGDPSDNALSFISWISTVPDINLQSLRYAAFGLGNSNYKHYNMVIDVATEGLNRAGATLMLPVGKADDATGMSEEDFLDWTEKLLGMFSSDLGYTECNSNYEPTIEIIKSTSLSIPDDQLETPISPKINTKRRTLTSSIAPFSINEVRELVRTPSSDKRYLHIEFDLVNMPDIKYKTGDHLAVWPVNSNEEIKRLLDILCLNPQKDTHISISSLDPRTTNLKIPATSTIQGLFRHHLDISAPISRTNILNLIQFAPTPEVREFLESIGKSKAAYIEFLKSHHINFGRLLEITNVSWPHLPLSFIIESLNPISPRYYSISSSCIVHPRNPSITVAIATSKLAANPDVKIWGLTTSYLSAFAKSPRAETATHLLPHSGTQIYAQIRRSKFKPPAGSHVPLILVAAGTGLAPFRGFLQERARLHSLGQKVGSVELFFGCRGPEEDFIYFDEIDELVKNSLKDFLTVITAFSRSDNHQKTYVQDQICNQNNISRVINLLVEEEAGLYICGSTAMSRDVTERLTSSMNVELGWSDTKASEWLAAIKRANKWQEDVWG